MKIRGPATATRSTVEQNLAQFNPHPRFVAEMLPALWAAAERYGIDPVVMVAQAGHETGWGHYGGLVPPEFHNTAGIKLRDLTAFPNSEVTEAHARFPDWPTGARAHAQHLLAYCQVAVPAAELVDPRWVWVFGRKPPIGDVEQLGGNWAPSPTYGERVAATATKLQQGGMVVAQLPGFEWVGGPRAAGSTYIDGSPWRICLHTTETPPISRGGNPARMAATHNTPPHVWYDWEADQGWQSVTLDRGAFALWNDGDPQTNRARCLQVELIGYSEETPSWPQIAYERIAYRVVAPLVGWVTSVGGNIDLSDAAVPLAGAIPGSASEYAPQRLSAHQWMYGPIGLVGHRHVPDNDHWDPGALDLRRIAALAGGSLPPASLEDDLTPEQDARDQATHDMLKALDPIIRQANTYSAWNNQLLNPMRRELESVFWGNGNFYPSVENEPNTVASRLIQLQETVARLEAEAAEGPLGPAEKVVDVEASLRQATAAQLWDALTAVLKPAQPGGN